MSGAHRDLLAWQKAMELVTSIYAETESFPKQEIYGLTRQLREASVSVPSNIAEGKGMLSKKEYIQFLSRARASLYEVETQLEIGKNLEFLSSQKLDRSIFVSTRSVGLSMASSTKFRDKWMRAPVSRELSAVS